MEHSFDPHTHLFERHLKSLFRMSDSAKQSHTCFIYPIRRVWIDNCFLQQVHLPPRMWRNWQESQQARRLPSGPGAKLSCWWRIFKIKSVMGVGSKYLRTIRMRNYQELENKIINFNIVVDSDTWEQYWLWVSRVASNWVPSISSPPTNPSSWSWQLFLSQATCIE